jgi:hypothetical protein
MAAGLAPSYRLFGVVGAKTIPAEAGASSILVPAEVACGLDGALLGRLIEHEALHAAIHQRGESLNDLCERLGFDENSRPGILAGMSGIAAEEYRVERALDDDGLMFTDPHCSLISETLVAFRDQIVDGITLRWPGEPIDRAYQTVMAAFHRTTLLFAYVAAEELATSGEVVPDRTAAHWQRLVGRHYDEYKQALSKLPSASAATSLANLDAIARELEPVLESWLADVGFELWDLDVGFYFDVRRHDV